MMFQEARFHIFPATVLLLLALPAVSYAQAKTAPAKLDINTAPANQLQAFPGMGAEYARRIVEGRPYANKSQLVSRGVIPAAAYEQIKDQIIATRPKKEK